MRYFQNRAALATLLLGGALAATTIQCEVPDIQFVTGHRHDDGIVIIDDGGYWDDDCCDNGWFDWWW